MIEIGFTGTRRSMTDNQAFMIRRLLSFLNNTYEAIHLHHGQCLGADLDMLQISQDGPWRKKMHTVSHPPTDTRLMHDQPSDETRKALPYISRNRVIVRASQLMIATPYEDTEQIRGGTWATVRFARQIGRPIIVIPPSGF